MFCQLQKLASQSLVLSRKTVSVTRSKELTTTTKGQPQILLPRLALTLTCTKGTVRSFSTALRSGRSHFLIVSGSILSLQTREQKNICSTYTGIKLRSSCDRFILNTKTPGLKRPLIQNRVRQCTLVTFYHTAAQPRFKSFCTLSL